jgi:hypothetical protein
MTRRRWLLALICMAALPWAQRAHAGDPKEMAADELKKLAVLGSDAKVVAAVKAFNASPPAVAKDMDQAKWSQLSVLSPEVKTFTKNDLASYLKSKKSDKVTEIFVSGADGTKVAFLAKPTSWSHKGKPKHDKPMSGKTWIGNAELDESSGKLQIQVSFPVLDGGKAIGSVVVGLDASKP